MLTGSFDSTAKSIDAGKAEILQAQSDKMTVFVPVALISHLISRKSQSIVFVYFWNPVISERVQRASALCTAAISTPLSPRGCSARSKHGRAASGADERRFALN